MQIFVRLVVAFSCDIQCCNVKSVSLFQLAKVISRSLFRLLADGECAACQENLDTDIDGRLLFSFISRRNARDRLGGMT